MSITACLSVRNWFLPEVKQSSQITALLQTTSQGGVEERRAPVGVPEDVALAVASGELEGEGGVVALQHGRVVVEDGQVAPGVAQEGVGSPRVVHVMHRGRYQSRDLIQLVQTVLDETAETEGRHQDTTVAQFHHARQQIPSPLCSKTLDFKERFTQHAAPLTLTLSERRK